MRPDRDADLAAGRVQARREARRPARDVPVRRVHDPVQPRRSARHVDPVRLRGAGRRPADRAPAPRAAARRGRRSSASPAPIEAPPTGTAPSPGARREPARTRADFEAVIGLEVPRAAATVTKIFSGASADVRRARPTARRSRTRSALPGTLPVLNRAPPSSARSSSGWRPAARSARRSRFARKHYYLPGPAEGLPDLAVRRAARASTARSSSGRPATRSARGPPHAHPPRRGRGQEHARRAARRTRSSTTTAPASRWSRSSPSPTFARPRRPWPTCAPSGRWCDTSASPTATWTRDPCAATPTSRCARAARRSTAPRPSSRT